DETVERRDHLVAALDRERAAGAEVVLHVHHDESASDLARITHPLKPPHAVKIFAGHDCLHSTPHAPRSKKKPRGRPSRPRGFRTTRAGGEIARATFRQVTPPRRQKKSV